MAKIDDLKKQKQLLEEQASIQRSLYESDRRRTIALKESLRLQKQLLDVEKEIDKYSDISKEKEKLSLEKQIINLQKSGLGSLSKELGLESQIKLLKEKSLSGSKEEVKEATKFAKLLSEVNSGSKDLEGVLNDIVNEDFGTMLPLVEDLADVLRSTPDLSEKLKIEADAQAKIDEWGNKIKETSALLSSPKAMGVAAIGMAVKLMKDFVDKALELRQSLGTTAVESARLAGNITAASVAAKVVGGSSQEAEAAVTGLVQEFGSLSVVSAGVSAKLGLMTGQFGISGANAAKLLKTMESINGASIETNLNLISSVGELARAEGVAPAQVLNDIAENTETFAQFAKDGGQNIAKAAIEARKLGLNLSTVAGIAENLLDFESSIEKEMEASMLLGRQMNLDKARELALSGKLAELAEEVKNQVGSQADFEAMNVVQRKALADAMGVTVADMGKMVAGEKTSAEVAEERVETEKKQADLQMAMMGTMAGMQIIQTALVALEQLKGTAIAKNLAKTVASAGASLAKGAGSIFSGFGMIPFGLGIPLAIAAVAGMYGLAKKAKSSVPSGLTGGTVTKTGMAEIHKGEAFSGTKNEMGFGTDMTETNGLLKQSLAESKKLREQNEFLMNRLTGRVDGLALSN